MRYHFTSSPSTGLALPLAVLLFGLALLPGLLNVVLALPAGGRANHQLDGGLTIRARPHRLVKMACEYYIIACGAQYRNGTKKGGPDTLQGGATGVRLELGEEKEPVSGAREEDGCGGEGIGCVRGTEHRELAGLRRG